MNAQIEQLKPNYDVLGVPCNQFAYQEPGANNEILNGVKYIRPGGGYVPNFTIVAKVDVNGANEHPLFTYLKSSCGPTKETIGNSAVRFWSPFKTSDITWNFEKFLIDMNGKPRYRFPPSVLPNDIVPVIKMLIDEGPKKNGAPIHGGIAFTTLTVLIAMSLSLLM